MDVLERAFTPDRGIESGLVELTLAGAITAPDADLESRASIAASGVFEQGQGELPEFNLALDVAQSEGDGDFTFQGGAIATDDAGFIVAEDQSYEVDDSVSEQLRAVELAQLDPGEWVLEPSSEGIEEVDGTETIHISGSANVETIFEELQAVAQQAGIAADTFEGASAGDFTKAGAEVFIGAGDRILRRLELHFEWDGELEGGEDFTGTSDVVAAFADVNEDQEIEAPESPLPLSEFAANAPVELSGLVEFLGGEGHR